MKKILVLAISALLLVAISVSVSYFVFAGNGNPIAYGKKYYLENDEKNYYVFNADKTGYFVYYSEYRSSVDPKYDYIHAGRVEFIWRTASDGAVYLFKTTETYDEVATEETPCGVFEGPVWFSRDFLVNTTYGQYGASDRRYIEEGTKLYKKLKSLSDD